MGIIDSFSNKPIKIGDVFESTDQPKGHGDICDVIEADEEYAVLQDRVTGEKSRILKSIVSLAMRRLARMEEEE